ncbi:MULTISPECIES: helix-turn-helix domain-containing protein [unclassified Streptomyces]|uniref:helix-turn-helix domain-containing protein n=1 Tax=unclassified Streptomyces TaxID=2593676 RepID=UPI0036BC7A0C
MDTQHCSAPAFCGGVIHVVVPHTREYVVVGNHLAQHEHLSLTAIGLAVHIQSLPAGTRIGVKILSERFEEGAIRIAAALRALERYGYLERVRERRPDGRLVTRTTFYNQPGAVRLPDPEPEPDPDPDPGPAPALGPGCGCDRAGEPAAPAPTALPRPSERPARATSRTEPVPLPQGPAADLLLGLRHEDPRLLLSARDVHRLAPAVDTWFARGATPDAVTRTLTATLPDRLTHPAGLLAHRLETLLPPPLPATRPATPRPEPFQDCDSCERVFRAREPGTCPRCAADARQRAA